MAATGAPRTADSHHAVVNIVTIFCKEDHKSLILKRTDDRRCTQKALLGEPGNRPSSMGFVVLMHGIGARLAIIASNVHEKLL